MKPYLEGLLLESLKEGRRSLAAERAMLAYLPAKLRPLAARALRLKHPFSARDYAVSEACGLARGYLDTTGTDDEACELASHDMAERGWKISAETIHRAEFQRKDTAVTAIRYSGKSQ